VTATYPTDAACATVKDKTLWDAAVHGETPEERTWRHHQAKAVCRRCPVAFECAQAIDWTWDEGVRAGELLPDKKTAARPFRVRGAVA
jgi:hypothetical protein